VVWTGRAKHVDVPLSHPLRAAIEVSLDPPDRVRFAYDAAAFGPSQSGQVEVRLRTPQAAHIADLLAAALKRCRSCSRWPHKEASWMHVNLLHSGVRWRR
jgi:hypothetical protein